MQAALQQHRTALMADSSDADLYLITGGTSQFLEMNGGTLVQDPYDLMTTGALEYIGEGYLTSLNEMENRVSHGKFTTAYDYELLNLLSAWHAGAVSDLDAALEELYGDWALYLDE